MSKIVDRVNDQIREDRSRLLAVCRFILGWLESFNVPPSSTAQEKEDAMAVLRRTIADVGESEQKGAAP